MLWEQQDEDGRTNCILDGYLIKPPFVDDRMHNGHKKRMCSFVMNYGYTTTLEGKNVGKSIRVTVWSKILVDLCSHLKENEWVIVFGRKQLDEAFSEKIGTLAYNVQASSVLPIKMMTEAVLYLKEDKRKTRELEKQVRLSLKEAEQIRRADIRYDGMNDSPFDAGF